MTSMYWREKHVPVQYVDTTCKWIVPSMGGQKISVKGIPPSGQNLRYFICLSPSWGRRDLEKCPASKWVGGLVKAFKRTRFERLVISLGNR